MVGACGGSRPRAPAQLGGPLTGSDGDSKDDNPGDLWTTSLAGPMSRGPLVTEFRKMSRKRKITPGTQCRVSQRYVHSASGHTWTIEPFRSIARSGFRAGFTLASINGRYRNTDLPLSCQYGTEAFRSMTLTPRDALLMELAWMTADHLRDTPDPPTLSAMPRSSDKHMGRREYRRKADAADAVEILGVITSFPQNVPKRIEQVCSMISPVTISKYYA